MHRQVLIEDGIKVAFIIDMWVEPLECGMCGSLGHHNHCVPWYEGPTREGQSDHGYRTVCKSCHDRWAEWGGLGQIEDKPKRDDYGLRCAP